MNKLTQRSAFILGLTAIGARLFFAAFIDLPQLGNAAWITMLSACLVSLPFAFALRPATQAWHSFGMHGFERVAKRLFLLLNSAFCAYDCGCIMRLIQLTAQHTVLEDVPSPLLPPLLAIGAVLCALGGVQAASGIASVSLLALACLALLTAMLEFPQFNARWLTPALGPGPDTLLRSSGYLSGLMTALFPLWLLRDEAQDDSAAFGAPALSAAISLAAAIPLVMSGMLAPALEGVPVTRFFQIDRLFLGCRIEVSIQFIVLIALHVALMTALICPLACSAALLSQAFSRIRFRLALILCMAASLVASRTPLAEREAIWQINMARWPLISFPVISFALNCRHMLSKRKEGCE